MAEPPAYWFPAKRYGWGWSLPACWQGWAVMLAYAALVFLACLMLSTGDKVASGVLLALSTAALFVICLAKGEPPRWRWSDD